MERQVRRFDWAWFADIPRLWLAIPSRVCGAKIGALCRPSTGGRQADDDDPEAALGRSVVDLENSMKIEIDRRAEAGATATVTGGAIRRWPPYAFTVERRRNRKLVYRDGDRR